MKGNGQARSDTLAPHSAEAEEAVLGAVLVNPDSLIDVAAILKPEDFYLLRHSLIYQAMLRLNERGDFIDNLTVNEELKEAGDIQEVGSDYVLFLISNCPSSVQAGVYARLVERVARRRRLLQVASDIAQLANDDSMDVNEIEAEADRLMTEQVRKRTGQTVVTARDALDQHYAEMEMYYENPGLKPEFISTGIPAIDRALGGGLMSEELIMVGGPTGGGKSWLLQQMAMDMAGQQGLVVWYWSAEMSIRQMVQRGIQMDTGLPNEVLRLGHFRNESDWKAYSRAYSQQREYPILYNDEPLTIDGLKNRMANLVSADGVQVVVMDYIQLAQGRRDGNREQEIGSISTTLKQVAREYKVLVLAATQLNEDGSARESRRIEHDSDYFVRIESPDPDMPANNRRLFLKKSRNSPGAGELYLDMYFNPTKCTWHGLEKQHQEVVNVNELVI